jgi:hypothetical protein
MLINLTAAIPKACPQNASQNAALFSSLRLALYILHQHKVYKVPSISTIVLIGINQSIGGISGKCQINQKLFLR